MRVVIVADDLTGAMDAAAPFADRGVPARVRLGVAGAAWTGAPHEVLSFDTDSRDRSPAQAADAVRAAFAGAGLAGALPFKKIDSTLRGHTAIEIAAALAATGKRLAIVCPAAPAHGRAFRRGALVVEGREAGDAWLAAALQRELPAFDVRAMATAAGLGTVAGPAVYVVDAAAEQDLDAIAAFALAHPGEVLLAGSSGLSGAVARQVPAPGTTRRLPSYERLWILVGSFHARSAEQVRVLRERCDVPAFVLSPATVPGALLASAVSAPVALVHVEGLGSPPRLDPAWVAEAVAQAAAALVAGIADERPAALFLTGGDTARGVLGRLGVTSIEVDSSSPPGVVHGRVAVQGRQLGVITKSGGFGEPGLLAALVRDSGLDQRHAPRLASPPRSAVTRVSPPLEGH
jgi:D-threonate/D-erythronate kinase